MCIVLSVVVSSLRSLFPCFLSSIKKGSGDPKRPVRPVLDSQERARLDSVVMCICAAPSALLTGVDVT